MCVMLAGERENTQTSYGREKFNDSSDIVMLDMNYNQCIEERILETNI